MVNQMSRSAFLCAAASIVLCCHGECFADKPNVVLMFADDMGYADGAGDTEIPIPNLKRLADDGVRFTNAYVSAPICVASRMGLMSGCHQQRFGIYGNVHGKTTNARALQQTLLPKVFQDAGYRTGLVGKWHLGGNGKAGFQYGGPLNRGFDEFVGISGGHSDFWEGTSILLGTKIIKAPKYLTDCWGDEACEFIERNTNNPFFLYLAFNAVHSPMHSLEADKVKLPGDKSKGEMRETYGGMMTAMDRSVGRVLDKLDALGLADNTIVMFLNDNGGGGHTDDYAEHSRNFADNSPYRGFKYDLYEGGIKTPFYMRWPGHIKKGSAYKAKVSSMDVYPTVVAAAGLKLPSQPCDGKDLMSYLNDPSQVRPHRSLCWENRCWSMQSKVKQYRAQKRVHNSAVRKDNWKLVRYAEKIDSKAAPPWQLYDLSKDASEVTDVSRQHPIVVKELEQVFAEWRASMHPSVEPKAKKKQK